MNVRSRQLFQLETEKARAQFAEDVRTIMRQQNVSLSEMADALSLSMDKTRQLIHSDKLTFDMMSKLAFCLGGTIRPLIIIPDRRNSGYDTSLGLSSNDEDDLPEGVLLVNDDYPGPPDEIDADNY